MKMLEQHKDIEIRAITVKKANVMRQFRSDSNRFYNYMIKTLLLKKICQSEYVDFMPDCRNERVNAKWNMGEYINQMVYEASFEHSIINKSCTVIPMDSANHLELQFIDFYAGMVWSKYEYQSKDVSDLLAMKNGPKNFKMFFADHCSI